jgi:hypothetical protein
LERIWKEEAVVGFIVAAFQYFRREDEKNKRNPHSKQPTLGPTIVVPAEHEADILTIQFRHSVEQSIVFFS